MGSTNTFNINQTKHLIAGEFLLTDKFKPARRSNLFIILISALLIAVLGIITLQHIQRTQQEILRLYAEKQKTLAQQAALNLENFISERKKAIEVLADFPASRKGDSDVFLSEYKRTYEKVEGFESIVYLDKTGLPKNGYPSSFPCPSRQPTEVWERFLQAFFKARDEGQTIVLLKNEPVNGKVLVCIISPIFSFDNHFAGAILGILDVKHCVEMALKPLFENEYDYAWILNDEGYLIYHPVHEDMLLNRIFNSDAQCLNCHQSFELERDALMDKRSWGVKSNKEQTKQLISFAFLSLDHNRWLTAVSSPYRQVTASVQKLSRHILLNGIFMLVIVLGGATLAIKYSMREFKMSSELQKIREQAALIDERNALQSGYNYLVKQSPDPVFLCTRKEILMSNDSAAHLIGLEKQKRSPNNHDTNKLLMILKDQDDYKKLVKTLKSRERLFQLPLQFHLNGETHYFFVHVRRFLFQNRITYQVVAHDITELRKLEHEKNKRERLAMLGEMASRISHEIKNPLASIQTGIQVLENRFAKDDQQKEYFGRIINEIQRVDSILKNLLNYARDEQLLLKPIDINHLLNNFAVNIQNQLESQKITLKLNLQQGIKTIIADQIKLEQVIWNLVLNALQASREGDTIEITTDIEDEHFIIIVQDYGKGIPPELNDQVFKPFFSTKAQGSGLGLAISQKYIELHHGKIRINSQLNSGTTVTIRLPLNKESV